MDSRAIHKDAIVIDAHNDSLARRSEHGKPIDLAVPVEGYHTDLPKLKQGGVTAMFTYCGSQDLKAALVLLQELRAMVNAHPEDMALVACAGDVTRAKAEGKVGLAPQFESLSCCMGELRILQAAHRLGLRVGNLTHGEALEHGCQQEPSLFDYCTAADREQMRKVGGLTDFGRAAIREMNDLGILVDLAHANDAAFYEALSISRTPPVFSHGTVFALCPHSRGLTDDQIRALAEVGGVHGVACYTKFIHREHPNMRRLVDLVEHSIGLVGPDHVGIGADYDGLPEEEIPVPPHVGRLGEITAEMASRGWNAETLRKVLGGNFLRVMRTALG